MANRWHTIPAVAAGIERQALKTAGLNRPVIEVGKNHTESIGGGDASPQKKYNGVSPHSPRKLDPGPGDHALNHHKKRLKGEKGYVNQGGAMAAARQRSPHGVVSTR